MPTKLSRECIIEDIKKTAKRLGVRSMSRTMYDKQGRHSVMSCYKYFGSWTNAVTAAGLVPIPQYNTGFCCGFKRHRLSPALAMAVYKRDHYRCSICGASPANDIEVELHVDHIYPVALGGLNGIGNLWLLCSKCNLRKHSKYDHEIEKLAFSHFFRIGVEGLAEEGRRRVLESAKELVDAAARAGVYIRYDKGSRVLGGAGARGRRTNKRPNAR